MLSSNVTLTETIGFFHGKNQGLLGTRGKRNFGHSQFGRSGRSADRHTFGNVLTDRLLDGSANLRIRHAARC